jgi:hypothetical protein
MGQYAKVSISPRSIAWLIRDGEWAHLLDVVARNCALLGGAANLLVLVGKDGAISEEYKAAIEAYDPDIVVLAPGQRVDEIRPLGVGVTSFAMLPWEARNLIGGPDPWSGGTGENAKIGSSAFESFDSYLKPLVPMWDPEHADNSRFALVACGDLMPHEVSADEFDGELHLDSLGAREAFLEKCLRPNFNVNDLCAHLNEDGEFVSAPNPADLARLISDDCKFPLVDPIEKLKATCVACDGVRPTCLATLTIRGLKKEWRTVPARPPKAPALTILVSESFGVEEAVLFWNLRGSGRKATWLSFSEVRGELGRIARWLGSDLGGNHHAMFTNAVGLGAGRGRIGFASKATDAAALSDLVGCLRRQCQSILRDWELYTFDEWVAWDQPAFILESKTALVSQFGQRCTIHSSSALAQTRFGRYVLNVDWDELRLPKTGGGFRELVSDRESHDPHWAVLIDGGSGLGGGAMAECRIDARRRLRAQFDSGDDYLLEFTNPSLQAVFDDMFRASGFVEFSRSSAAKYHDQFCGKSGGFDEACRYLTTHPFRDMLNLLSDNRNENLAGWLIDHPSKRRVLNHYHLLDFLRVPVPSDTKLYYDTVSDFLPECMRELINRGIVDRGFLLRCEECSYKSWYALGVLGAQFQCGRCDQRQSIGSNPLWLYKLNEVVFQGLADNMQVPLLTLNHFKRGSHRSFQWLGDSDVKWIDRNRTVSGNLDLVFACDGRHFLGEAKSSNEIPSPQFEFYEQIAKRAPVDCLVFSTARSNWSVATKAKIERLKQVFPGEVIVVTGDQLYPMDELDTPGQKPGRS